MIDFHCHLDLYPEPKRIADACRDKGLYVLSVTTTPSAWQGTSALTCKGDRIRTALGLHPQIAHERKTELPLFDELLPNTKYVGEIGLDGAPEFRRHWEVQITVFEHILRSCSSAGGKIMSLHSRRASRSVLDLLETYPAAGVPVMHWFSGSLRDVERAASLGCWFSVGPAMLHSAKGCALISRMPQERVLTESDGPFARLSGQPLYPWDVNKAISKLSEIWKLSPDECTDLINNNLRKLVETI